MIRVVRSRTGFRVVLHAEHRLMAVGHRRHRAVVEVQMGDVHLVLGKACGVERKPMVLAGDLHLASGAAGMVESAMAVTKLERFTTEGQTEDLMAEANPEQRQRLLREEATGQLNPMGDSRGVTRTVGEENPLGLMGENGVQIHRCGKHRDGTTVAHKPIENGPLDAEINRHNTEGVIASAGW